MDNETLKDYLANNSQVITIFMEKATDFLNRKNEDRAPARRYNDAEIARQADKMLDDVIANIHDKIVPHTREQTPAAWEQFLSENDVLDDLELSMTELSFESKTKLAVQNKERTVEDLTTVALETNLYHMTSTQPNYRPKYYDRVSPA